MKDRGRVMTKNPSETPKYRKLFPIFWDDDRVRKLDEGEQLLAAYILTSRQTNKIGLFRFSLAACAEDLDKPINTITKRIAKVCDTLEWKYDSDARCLYIPTWWKYNPPANVKNMVGNLRDLTELPNTVLLYEFAKNEKFLSGVVLDTLRKRMAYLADTNPISGALTGALALTGTGSCSDQTIPIASKAGFSKPDVDEVRAYCQERGNSVDPQRFVDHYTANGWRVGKAGMKDWRAAVRTWERDDPPKVAASASRLPTAEDDANWTPY